MSDNEIYYESDKQSERLNNIEKQDQLNWQDAIPHINISNSKYEQNITLENENGSKIFSDIQHNETSEEKDNSILEEKKNKINNERLDSMYDDLSDIKIDIEFFKKNLNSLPFKTNNTNNIFENLFILQDFICDSQTVWITKFSFDGRYLATAGQSGVLKIWTVYNLEESLENYEDKGLLSYIKCLNENAYRIYNEHSTDIIDLSWNVNVIYLIINLET